MKRISFHPDSSDSQTAWVLLMQALGNSGKAVRITYHPNFDPNLGVETIDAIIHGVSGGWVLIERYNRALSQISGEQPIYIDPLSIHVY